MAGSLTRIPADFSFIEADTAITEMSETWQYAYSDDAIEDKFRRLEELYLKGSESVRYKIISELIDMEFMGALPLLLEALKNDKSGLIRHEAAFGIGAFGDSSHTGALAEALLNDQCSMVRHEAAISLAEIGDEEIIPVLIEAESDPVSEVSASARFAIHNIQLKLSQEQEAC